MLYGHAGCQPSVVYRKHRGRNACLLYTSVEGIGVIKSYNLLGEKSEELTGNFKRSRNTSLAFERKMTPWTCLLYTSHRDDGTLDIADHLYGRFDGGSPADAAAAGGHDPSCGHVSLYPYIAD